MKITNNYNYDNVYLKDSFNNTKKKYVAEYIYMINDKSGQKKEKKFTSKYVSTIDIPYAKYILK